MMLDLLVCILPPVGVEGPLPGPALVTASAKAAGFSVRQVDWNLDFFNRTKANPGLVEWLNIDSLAGVGVDVLEKHFEPAIQAWVAEIVKLQPRWIGLSVFSNRCRYVLERLIPEIRRLYPQGKIALGGAGVFRGFSDGLNSSVDAVVIGEGEHTILEILRGNLSGAGINGTAPVQIEDLDTLPIPDYSDLPLEQYGTLGSRASTLRPKRRSLFYVEGSRGCVRKCSFCDVPFSKPGYRFRSPESIANEITHLNLLYGVQVVSFADSLVNGSLKHMRKLGEYLAQYRLENPNFFWDGYFIIRPVAVSDPRDFELLARSGAWSLFFGIESGSQRVRHAMNKAFLDEDVDFTLSQCLRTGIGAQGLFMVGFPNETEEDFFATLGLLERNQKAFSTLTSSVTCSWKVGIAGHDSELGHNPEKYGLKFDRFGGWYTESVNPLISAKRYFQFCEFAQGRGIRVKNKVSKKGIAEFLKAYGISFSDLEKTEMQLKELYLSAIGDSPLVAGEI